MLKCPKCDRKRRVVTKMKKLKGRTKRAWVDFCVECGSPLQLDTIDDETKTRTR